MYYVRIIDNWNQSQLNKYYDITLRAYVNSANLNDLVIMDERRFNLSKSFCEGSEITISGSSSGNDDEYTVSYISDVYENGKYFVQIIHLNETLSSGENFFNCTFSLTSGDAFYPEIEIKNSLDLSNGIFITSDSVERFEAQKFIGDDFFMSEPREATLEFLRTDWLISKFKTYNKSEEICNVLYYDEDGIVIEHENYDDPPDWDIGQVVTINNIEKTVYDKEIIIQQISKYVIEIHSINGDKRKKEFTGFVDKSQTKLDSSKITITINDSMKFVEVYANQLIKEIVDKETIEDYHLFISSKDEIDNIVNKINDMTKLNIEFVNNIIGNYYYSNILEMSSEIDISEAPYQNPSNLYDDNTFYSQSYKSNFISYDCDINVSDSRNNIIVYKPHSGWVYFNEEGNQSGANYAQMFFGVQQFYLNFDGSYEQIQTYRVLVGDPIEDNQQNEDEIGTDMPISIYKSELKKYKSEYYMYSVSLNEFDLQTGKAISKAIIRTQAKNIIYLYEIEYDRYGLIIPIYPDTYKYEDILRMILYVNELRFYCDNNGKLYIKELYPNENQEDVFAVGKRDILLDGYSEASVQKDYPNLSEALNPIWYDYENEGFFYKKLDITMKKIYENILIKRYPSELTCKILKRSMSTGEERNLDLHSILSCFNKFYIIVEIKENDTGFYYEVKAYELGNYNNNNIGSLYESIENNKLEDLNSNRFSTNKIWTDENLWIDSLGEYREER